MKYFSFLFLLFSISSIAQPKPGDVFREYVWIPELVHGESGKFLRVGGKLDYKINTNQLAPQHHKEGFIPFGKYIDLVDAINAEVILEKVGSHEDTKGLRIAINQHPSIVVPEAAGIPKPEADYMHHTYPITAIPMTQLTEGWDNAFRLDVDSTQRWNWPQNVIYGVILRVYYQADKLKEKTELRSLSTDNQLLEEVDLAVENPDQSIRQVDFIGWYDGLNYEGDGIYQQWHYHYFRGKIKHHIGTADEYPFDLNWNTSWLPDQKDPIKIAARVVSNDGLIYFTKVIDDLRIKRNYSVELVKLFDQPKNWVTREDEYSAKAKIKGDPKSATAARMIWVSWCPCYSNGIFINDEKVFDKEGPCYEYMAHDVLLKDLGVLKQGINMIATAKEPLHDGQMVHGMEIQWPGIMLLIKYKPE